jgi:anaphase-promoting complex subunit 5
MIIPADALQEAITYLQMAEADFKSLEIYRSVKDVQYLLSVVYHNLGMVRERDEVASRHSQLEEHQKRLEVITFDPLYQDVFEVVAKVGAALASRN